MVVVVILVVVVVVVGGGDISVLVFFCFSFLVLGFVSLLWLRLCRCET